MNMTECQYDLKLLPSNWDLDNASSIDVLDLKMTNELADAFLSIEETHGQDIQRQVRSNLRTRNETDLIYRTAFGNIMTYVPAYAIKWLKIAFYTWQHVKNKAVYAYIQELDDNHPIYLYWE